MAIKDNLHNLREKYKGTKMAPVFNAFHTFLFTPDFVTKRGSQVRDAADLKRVMNTVIIALVPCLLFGIWNAGYQNHAMDADWVAQNGAAPKFIESFTSGMIWWDYVCVGLWKVIPLVLVTYVVGLGIEFLFASWKGTEVEEGFLVTGMLVPLIVPVDLPLWMLAVAVAFGVVIGKEIFGGTGMNIVNPALLIRAFLFFGYPSYMSGNKIWVHEASEVDAISGETILGKLAANSGGLMEDGSVQLQNASVSVLDQIFGYIPGSVGETSVIAIGIGALILILTGIGSWRIILSTFLGGALTAYLLNVLGYNDLMQLAWWQHLIVGGFAFGAVFMATDPVSAAQTTKGKWIYGFLIGFFCIMVRIINPGYPEGMMLAILLMNVCAPLIDYYVVQGNVNKRLKRLKAVEAQ